MTAPNRLFPPVTALSLAITSLAASGCVPADTRTLTLGDIEYSTPPGSGEPNLFVTSQGRIVLSWHEPLDENRYALKLAVKHDNRWSEPLTVAQGRDFFVNWADFPSFIELSDGTWLVHWLEKVAASTYAYHVMLSISKDRGETWSEPFAAHRDGSPTEHGFVSMAATFDGQAALVWLDGRDMVGPAEEGDGEMGVRFTTISSDGELGPELLVDGRTCECCATALVQTAGGLVAAYRDRSDAEIRDIAISRYSDGQWSEPYQVANDNWFFPACPVNGPALAADEASVAVAWYTRANDAPTVYVAFSADGGSSFSAPVRVDGSQPLGRVDLEFLRDGSALVVWLEQAGEEAQILARVVSRSGETSGSWSVTDTSPTRRSGFPRMARLGNELIFAWTEVGEGGGVRVATGRISDQ